MQLFNSWGSSIASQALLAGWETEDQSEQETCVESQHSSHPKTMSPDIVWNCPAYQEAQNPAGAFLERLGQNQTLGAQQFIESTQSSERCMPPVVPAHREETSYQITCSSPTYLISFPSN